MMLAEPSVFHPRNLILTWVSQNLIAQSQSVLVNSCLRPSHAQPSGTAERYPQTNLVSTVERGQKISEHIVIGTPGTVLDWCSKLKFIDPKEIVFVLDEADTRKTASGLAAELSKEGHQVALLSGEMVVSRGLPHRLEQVSVVITLTSPWTRMGTRLRPTCTGSGAPPLWQRGRAVNMVDSKHSMNILNRIQEALQPEDSCFSLCEHLGYLCEPQIWGEAWKSVNLQRDWPGKEMIQAYLHHLQLLCLLKYL
ncbi:ATP-dependent RNA helicase DDX19A, partial [Camelus dromedarius]